MGKFRALGIGAMAALGAGCAASQALAASTCGLNNPNTVAPTVFYDPFNTSAQTNVSFSLPLTRFAVSGGQKTKQVNFYFGQSGSGPYQIAAGGQSVVYSDSGCHSNGCSLPGAPSLTPTGSNSGSVAVDFGATGNPDTLNVPLTITIPANQDLANNLVVTFDLFYQCNDTGGGTSGASNVFLSQAVTMPVKVLSALQAFYAGPAMDFGSIQGATAANFTTFKAPVTQNALIEVRSSGPYTLDLSSQNNFAMKWGASNAAKDTVKYSLHFLGQDLVSDDTMPTVDCVRAGITAEQQLPLRATLAESAQGKTASSAYQDTLTVTVTPVNIAANQQSCPAL
ncbi:MAG: hypothetical protein ACHP7N_02460 [Caulobacterales bacterium]